MIELDYNEEVATLTFRSTTERIVIGQERRSGKWVMRYLCAKGYEGAVITDGASREEILRQTKRFLIGHGQGLMSNLIEAWAQRCG